MTPDERIKEALESIGKITVFSHTYDEELKQINILFRVGDALRWLEIVDTILTEEDRFDAAPWNVHICKHYRRHNGSLKYGWNITVQINTDPDIAVNDLCRFFTIMAKQDPKPVRKLKKSSINVQGGRLQGGEVVEMPLIGVTADRNAPQAPIGTPGVAGRGRRSGVSSKGAHTVR